MEGGVEEPAEAGSESTRGKCDRDRRVGEDNGSRAGGSGGGIYLSGIYLRSVTIDDCESVTCWTVLRMQRS